MIAFLPLLWRRRVQHDTPGRVAWRLGAVVALFAAAHVAAMIALEGMGLSDAVWLTATTLTTVGYGDLSAKTLEGRAATILLLYIGSVFVLANAVGALVEHRALVKERKLKGQWVWAMQDHIVVVGTPTENPTQFFQRLATEIRAARSLKDRGIVLLTRAFKGTTLPGSLADLGVVHVDGRGTYLPDLAAASVKDAYAVVVLACSDTDGVQDALTIETVRRVREISTPDCRIVGECVDDRDRERMRAAGAGCVLRPMRGYPEMLVRGICAPGSEEILENLFTSGGDECVRVDLGAPATMRWRDVIVALATADVGVPIAYRPASEGAAIVTNPSAKDIVTASAVFVVAHEETRHQEAAVRAALAPYAGAPMQEPTP